MELLYINAFGIPFIILQGKMMAGEVKKFSEREIYGK